MLDVRMTPEQLERYRRLLKLFRHNREIEDVEITIKQERSHK